MNGLTRRVLLAGAALLPTITFARPVNASSDVKLLDLAARWWRIENAANESSAPPWADSERAAPRLHGAALIVRD